MYKITALFQPIYSFLQLITTTDNRVNYQNLKMYLEIPEPGPNREG